MERLFKVNMSMEFDLLLDPFGARWSDLRDTAEVAIDAGFAGIWIYDHLDGRVYDAPFVLECWTVLSALSAAVPRGVLGSLVLNAANRHPGLLATMAATLQETSGGRVMLGIGAGGGDARFVREQVAIGRTVPADPVRRVEIDACISEVRSLWGSPGYLEPDPHPPFIVGGFGPKMAELAGRVGDGMNTRATHPRLPELISVARDACERAGGDPAGFLVTVLADFGEPWLARGSQEREGLYALGVDRVILFVPAPYDRRRITVAGRLL
jgi:alkanesulfonate monooxygenase SsuD/methylene tetrahydromethanopterin reductase-like flavin-dependent oxidoreductase (luciferase family)